MVVGRLDSHRDLIAWKKAIKFEVTCYGLTRNFPSDERFGLTQQLRRYSVLVPAKIANGPFNKLDTHLVIAKELEYITYEELGAVVELIAEVGRITTGLRKTLSV